MAEKRKSVKAIVAEDQRLNEHHWLLEVGALWIYEIILRICPFWWAIDRREKEGEYGLLDSQRVLWISGWLILMVVFWLLNPVSPLLRNIFALVVLLRLLEIFTTSLGTVLNRYQQARARSLITIGVYALQSAFIFAILEHSWATNAYVYGNTHASRAFDYLFISWTNMTTIGNNVYIPTSDISRILQMVTTTSGVLLLGVLLAFGINHLPKQQD